jgi:hypothetical protein
MATSRMDDREREEHGTYQADGRDSQQIRRDIEHTRHEMDDTLEEIGERLHPKNLFDYAMEFVRSASSGTTAEDAGTKLRSTADQFTSRVRQHPMPAALIGVGLLWWMLEPTNDDSETRRNLRLRGGRRRAPHGPPAWHPGYDWTQSQEDEQSWTDRARDVVEKIKNSLSDAKQSTAEKLSSASSSVIGLSGMSRDQIRNEMHSRWADLEEHSGSFVNVRTGKPYEKAEDDWDYLSGMHALGETSESEFSTKDWSEKASSVVEDIKASLSKGGDNAREVLGTVAAKLGSFGNSISETTQTWRDRAAEGARSAWDSTSSSAQRFGESARDLGSRSQEQISRGYSATRDRMAQEMDEHPLAAGAAALGLGMLAGFMLPRTRTEDRWMGAAAEDVREQAMEKGEEMWDRGKKVAQETVQAAKDEAESQGLSPENLASKAKKVASQTVETAKEKTREQM